ncbi:MAG: hypothetical protein ABSH47_25175 [Bryobacteraceae bacterium]|jgi:hypothetical protein
MLTERRYKVLFKPAEEGGNVARIRQMRQESETRLQQLQQQREAD